MAFRHRGNQLASGAGRALLGAPTRLRGYCQQVSSTDKEENERALDKAVFLLGAFTATLSYLIWARWQQAKIDKLSCVKQASLRAVQTRHETLRGSLFLQTCFQGQSFLIPPCGHVRS